MWTPWYGLRPITVRYIKKAVYKTAAAIRRPLIVLFLLSLVFLFERPYTYKTFDSLFYYNASGEKVLRA